MHYLPFLILIWYKIAIARMFYLMDKKDHKDSNLDKVMMLPIILTLWATSKMKK